MLQVLSAISPLHAITEELNPALLIPAASQPPAGEPAHDTTPTTTGDGRPSTTPTLPTIDEASREEDSSFEAMAVEWFCQDETSAAPVDPAFVEAARAIADENLEPLETSNYELKPSYVDAEPTLICPDISGDDDMTPEPDQLEDIDGEAALTLLVAREVEKCFTAEDIKPDERLI